MSETTRAKLESRGLRCTKQRLAVYEVLHASKSHPTADELFRLVEQRCGPMSLATVYNSLSALVDAGLCRRVMTAKGPARFDADISNHVHVRMQDDGRLIDVPDHLGHALVEKLPRELLSQIEDELGIDINDVHIQLEANRSGKGAS